MKRSYTTQVDESHDCDFSAFYKHTKGTQESLSYLLEIEGDHLSIARNVTG
jgi:hypothetical protein